MMQTILRNIKTDGLFLVFLSIFSVCFAASGQYVNTGEFTPHAGFLVGVVFYFIVGLVIRRFFGWLWLQIKTTKLIDKLTRRYLLLEKKGVHYLPLGLLLCWTPYVISLFPGVLFNDTTSQLSAYIGRFVLGDDFGVYDRNPLFDTFVFGFIIHSFGSLLGSLKAGVAVYVFMQLIAMSLVFTKVVADLRHLGVPDNVRTLVFGFFALFPMVPIWCMSISKDSLYCIFFIMFCMDFIKIGLTPKQFFANPLNVAKFTFYCVLSSLTKKTGVYIVVISLAVMMTRRQFRKHLVAPLLVTVAVMYVFLPGITSALGVKSGGRQEMLAVPLQQTARYVKSHPDDIELWEKEAIDELLGFDDLADRYNYANADPVKGFTELGSLKDYVEWFKAWVSMGVRHPLTYFDAFAALEAPWVSLEPIVSVFNSDHHVSSVEKYIPETTYDRNGFFEFTSSQLRQVYYAMTGLPLIGLLFSVGLYSVIIPGFSFFAFTSKIGMEHWRVYLPVLLTVATLFVSPVAVGAEASRYIIGLVYLAPIQLAICALPAMHGQIFGVE